VTNAQPPPVDPGTDSSDNWFVELFLEGTVVNSTTTPDAQTTTVTFNMLMKGTLYSVRVRGINEFGIGSFSSFVIGQTAVDRKLQHILAPECRDITASAMATPSAYRAA
jgi:hypothetical protein